MDRTILRVSAPDRARRCDDRARRRGRVGRLRLPRRREEGRQTRLAYDNARLREQVHSLEQAQAENRQLRRLLQLKDSMAERRDQRAGHRQGLHRVLPRHAHRARPRARATCTRTCPSSRPTASSAWCSTWPATRSTFSSRSTPRSAWTSRTSGRTRGASSAGTGDPARYACKVEMVDSRDEVEIGDLLVTSGKGRWFPRGLPVARVTRVVKRELGRDQDVDAVPTRRFLAPRRRARPRDGAGRGVDRLARQSVALTARAGGPECETLAFLGVGLALLLLQANVFRALDGITLGRQRPSGARHDARRRPRGAATSARPALTLACSRRSAPTGRSRRACSSATRCSSPWSTLASGAPFPRWSCRSSCSWACTSIRWRAAPPSPSSSATRPTSSASRPSASTRSRTSRRFVLARAAGVRLAAQTPWMQVLLVGAFAVLQSTMILVLLAIFGRDPWVPAVALPARAAARDRDRRRGPARVPRVARRLHMATSGGQRAEPSGGAPP